MDLFDSHCHLQNPCFSSRITRVLARARQAGVTRFLCCATSEADWDQVASLARDHEGVLPAFGIHPWYMQGCSQGWENRLKDLVVTFGSAIGECGLDFAVKGVDRKAQERVFAAQLNIAHDLKRPVSVHCRHAWDCCIGLIKDLGGLPAGGVVHSFSGSAETASVLEGLGLRISFSGTVTNPRSVRVHAAAEAVSDECLLIETDSPDLIPYAIQNLESDAVNEPANLVAVVRSLALVRGRSEEEIAELTYRNGTALFTPA